MSDNMCEHGGLDGNCLRCKDATIAALREEQESSCGKPCHPDRACDECADYWQRMINEGYWSEKGKRWTDKGWREITK